MANERRATTLGDVVQLQRGHDLPEPERRPGSVPVMGSFGITGWHDEPRAKGPGVTVGRSGASIGVVSLVEDDYWPLNTCLYVTDFRGNDPTFCYYWLKTLDLAVFNSGSAQPSLNRNYIYGMPVSVPDPDEQRAIAHILGALDDKIELNRRMNDTLEAMARAMFKSWFVDFDPVRAKAEGRDPGLPNRLADLFPDSFQVSSVGKTPTGWKVGRLDEMILLQRGFDLPTPNRTPGPYPVMAASGPSGTHAEYKVRGPGITTGRSGLLGKVFFVHEDFWPLNTSLWVKEFRGARPVYAFHLLRDLDFSLFNAGSAVPTLNRNHVHGLPVVVPPIELVEKFEELAAPMYQRVYRNQQGSGTVAVLRDTLLLKLISGELRVNDAERIAGVA